MFTSELNKIKTNLAGSVFNVSLYTESGDIELIEKYMDADTSLEEEKQLSESKELVDEIAAWSNFVKSNRIGFIFFR